MNIPKVIDSVVKNDLCIGCGLCAYKCPTNALEMKWNKLGFLNPELTGNCDTNGDCLEVCPFNPFPEDEVRTENEIAEIFFQNKQQFHPKIGKYINIYAGYSNEHRITSSSGGMATYILTELLERGIVDHVFSVSESTKPGIYYEYAVNSSKEELLASSKTKYFPVTLGTVMPKLHELQGKVAIVGVGCFIKAIRLAQHKEPSLKEKIPFLVGIICGGVKSRFFTEYLAGKLSIDPKNIEKPQFRIKDYNSSAGDYYFGCYDKRDSTEKVLRMHTVGDMWGTGMFKANACDFCDDITTELADISLGDAWLDPYRKDGYGNNVIITRTILADKIIQKGIDNGELKIDVITEEQLISSQRGNYNHRQKGLGFRIRKAPNKNAIPPKRYSTEKISTDFAIVQLLRSRTRKSSLEIWEKNLDSNKFEEAMYSLLKQLQVATKVYHFRNIIGKKVKEFLKVWRRR